MSSTEPTPAEVMEVLRRIVNRWSGDYHCCPDNKHGGATHAPGCPLVAGLLLLARSTQLGPSVPPHSAPAAQETPTNGAPETDKGPLPNRTGPLVRMCQEGNAWLCNGYHRFGCAAEGCRAPDRTGPSGYEAPTLTELHGAEAEEARTIVAGVVIVDGPGDPCDDCGRVPCTCR